MDPEEMDRGWWTDQCRLCGQRDGGYHGRGLRPRRRARLCGEFDSQIARLVQLRLELQLLAVHVLQPHRRLRLDARAEREIITMCDDDR